MATYEGLLVRTAFGDTGAIPAPECYWTAPDIIPFGRDVLTYEQAVETYGGPDIGKPIVNNLNNNIYVRCKNVSNNTMRGNVNLYYANASLFLLPGTWTRLAHPNVGEPFVGRLGSTEIAEGKIAIVQAPFLLSHLQPGQHFCFIAVVNNNNIPFGIPPKFDSNADYIKWIRCNPNVAQRNIEHQNGSDANITEYLTFGNANPMASQFLIAMIGHNIPLGTRWEAMCTDKRLEGGQFHDQGTFSAEGTAALRLMVPKNVGNGTPLMTMAFTFSTPNGKPFSPSAYFDYYYYQVPTAKTQSEDLHEKEKDVIGRYRVPAAIAGGGDEMQELIELGSVDLRLS